MLKMTYPCPKDPTHLSDDPDYCSVCGAKIAGTPMAVPAAPQPTAIAPTATADSSRVCPDCGTPRTGGARFCEVCRHDFGAGPSGTVAPATPPARRDLTPPPPPMLAQLHPTGEPDLGEPSPLPPPALGARGVTLEVVAVVDPSLYVDPDPSMVLPTDEPPRTFPLDLAENLIGRRSDKRDIPPGSAADRSRRLASARQAAP